MPQAKKKWIQGAIKKPGSLRAQAKRTGIVTGEETLSASDLKQMEKGASTTTKKRINLARTLKKMRKK